MLCKTPVTQMIFFNQGMLIQGSNYSVIFLNTTLIFSTYNLNTETILS